MARREEQQIGILIFFIIICIILWLIQPLLAIIMGLITFVVFSIEYGFKFPFWVYLLIGIIIVGLFLWYVNVLLGILFIIGVSIVGFVFLYFYLKEREQRAIEEAKIKETLFYKVAESIKNFPPSRRYGNEFAYHTELQGWLKSQFREAKVEIQTGASRPDIVIADIAIEVKGPTDTQALNTLATKCLKYSQYYTHLIIVLFEPRFSESNYSEIVEGIKRYFPNVEVIRKD